MLGFDHTSNAASTVDSNVFKSGKNLLCVFSLLVILHTCSIGFKSGEYGGIMRNSTLSLTSEYSDSFSVAINLIAFLCQGELSITRTYFLPSEIGFAARNSRIDKMVVS